MAKRKSGRPVNGILLLDKPVGMTSNQALQTAKRLLNARKGGHTGSLDPMADGLLPLCFGEATKVSSYLLDADKTYRTIVRLGERTSSGDLEGEVIERRPLGRLQEKMVQDVLLSFTGEVEQVPPMHSALKRDGVPLYKLARKGIEVERAPRLVQIYELELLRMEAEELELQVRCSKGTYIRSLAEDIGEALGCGGHITALTRLASGPFSLDNSISLEKLAALGAAGPEALDALLVPMESALKDWPQVMLSDDAAYYIRMGQAVFVPKLASDGLVRLNCAEGFLGIGQVMDDGRVAPKRLLGMAGS